MATVQRRNRQRGKSNERKVAELLGGERLAILGNEDVRIDGTYYVECKSVKKYPKWFSKFWTQTLDHTPVGKCPVLQMHETGTRHLESDLVVIPLYEFANIIEALKI